MTTNEIFSKLNFAKAATITLGIWLIILALVVLLVHASNNLDKRLDDISNHIKQNNELIQDITQELVDKQALTDKFRNHQIEENKDFRKNME